MSCIAEMKQISENLTYTSHGYANPGVRKRYKRRSAKLTRLEAKSLIQEQLDSEREVELAWDEAILEDIDFDFARLGIEVYIDCDCSFCMPDAP